MKLLEIERELAGPERASAMEKYDQVLVALEERLAGALSTGVPPDEYHRCEELQQAIVTARKLLRLQVKKADEAETGRI